jgi:hypothetical protein
MYMVCAHSSNSDVTLTGTVVIEVGPEHKEYHIHRVLLEYHSEYFLSALSGRWKESDESVLLEDVSPRVFNLFVNYLYTGNLPKDGVEWDQESHRLVQACALGDRLLAPQFRALANNSYVNNTIRSRDIPFYADVIFAYDNLPATHPLLSFLVDAHCAHWSASGDEQEDCQHREQLPKEFLVRVMLRYEMLKHITFTKWPKLDPCSYHEHATEDEKDACKVEGLTL